MTKPNKKEKQKNKKYCLELQPKREEELRKLRIKENKLMKKIKPHIDKHVNKSNLTPKREDWELRLDFWGDKHLDNLGEIEELKEIIRNILAKEREEYIEAIKKTIEKWRGYVDKARKEGYEEAYKELVVVDDDVVKKIRQEVLSEVERELKKYTKQGHTSFLPEEIKEIIDKLRK